MSRRAGRARARPSLCDQSLGCRLVDPDWLSAMRTAAGIDWDLAEALAALLGRGIGRYRRLARARHQHIHRGHDKEVNCRGHEQKGNSGVNEVANREDAPINGE